DYSNQWHILEQLKSSVAVVDPFADTNHLQNRTLTPESITNAGTAEGTLEEKKADGTEWYILPDAVSSGHSSDTGSDSAFEISDLRNATDISYSSNKSTTKTSSQNKHQSKEHLNKDSLYQEQWHVLEELKASVKAMQWSSHTSDSSLEVSHKRDTPTRTGSKHGDFVEPHKRTPSGSVNSTSGSISSSGNTSMESGVRSAVSSQVPPFIPSSSSFSYSNSLEQSQGISFGSGKLQNGYDGKYPSRDGMPSEGLYYMPSVESKVLSWGSDAPTTGNAVLPWGIDTLRGSELLPMTINGPRGFDVPTRATDGPRGSDVPPWATDGPTGSDVPPWATDGPTGSDVPPWATDGLRGSDVTRATDGPRESDVPTRATDGPRGSDVPLWATDGPKESEVPLRATDGHRESDVPPMTTDGRTGSEVPTRATDGPRRNEVPPRNSVVSDRGADILLSGKEPLARERDAPIEVNQHSSLVSSFETPLTSLRSEKRTWAGGSGSSGLNLRYSSLSAMKSHDEAEDTDDLLSYEAVLEGDIKYFRNLKNNTQTSTKGHFYSSSINSKTEGLTPSHLTGDISSINGSADRDPLRQFPVSVGSSGLRFPNSDEQTKRYHLSLGAGEVRPVEINSDYKETYRQPVGTLEEDESDAALSSDALEIEDYEDEEHKEGGYFSVRNTTPATESSSSSMYQPYIPKALRQPASAKRESELTGNSSSTYGVYDIRHSSGPGSTNRRRKAMGLSPIPGRVSKPANGVVYVSGDSSPLSMPEEGSTDEGSKHDQNTRDETLKENDQEMSGSTSSHQYSSSERRRTSSRESRNSRHSEEEHELQRQRSSSKEGSFRTRSRGSSLEEAKLIDDYIGGRKTIQHGKPRQKSSRSREVSHSDESHSSREYSTSAKNTDLNQMWERFQESLKSSPRSKKDDSVSSHLSRLSALLSKPIDIITTSSETEAEQYRKPRSHSYASSSSDVSTESEQPYQVINQQNYSLTRQIQLRKLLETVNIADVPAFPRLRYRDTTTTSSTLSDTSTSEIPMVHTSLPRSNRGARKVSKTPVLESFVKTKSRSAEIGSGKPKCICAINTAKPAALAPRSAHDLVEKKSQRPQTYEVGTNVPSPTIARDKKPVRTKKGYVDVGVQTRRDSDDDSDIQPKKDAEKHRQREKRNAVEKSTQRSTGVRSNSRRKDRHIASQNSPENSAQSLSVSKHKERHIASQNSTSDSTRLGDDSTISLNGWDDSNEQINLSRKDARYKGRRHKERNVPSQNSPESKYKTESHRPPLDTSGPVWFYPMTNRHYSRPSTNPTSAVRPEQLRFEEQTVKTYSPPAAPPSTSMQKLSLQEAFFFAKPDFVKRSRARITRIDHNKSIRESGETKAMGEDRVSKMEIPVSKPAVNNPTTNPRTEKLHRPKPRQISKKDMKTQNL
ncbi:hypothetical protein QZH41_019503, partial [Actinostola sp. cb2023]